MSNFLRSFFTFTALVNITLFNQSANAFVIYSDAWETFTVSEDSSASHSIYQSVDTSYKYFNYTLAANGSVAYNSSTKRITYTPHGNYCGTDSYTYTLDKYIYNSGGGDRPRNLNSVEIPSTTDNFQPNTNRLTENLNTRTINKNIDSENTLALTRYMVRVTTYVTVSCKNDLPSISNIANKVINEDSNTGNVAFTISDVETPASSLTLSTTSSNTALVPSSGIAFGGSGSNRTIRVTPLPNKYGSATINVTVRDASGGTRADAFVVTVNSINDLPSISNIANKVINEDSNTGNVAFTISDVETPASSLTLSTTSSNTALVPSSGIVVGGSGSNRTIRVTPMPNKYGSATINVTVRDASGGTRADAFVVTVNSVNDAPVITQGTSLSFKLTKDSMKTVILSATDIDSSTLTWSIKTQGTKGIATINSLGTLNYVLNSNTQVDDSDHFIVQVSDSNQIDTITIYVEVIANKIQYKYDARGRLIKVSNSMDEETKYYYDDAGNRKSAGRAN